MSETLATAAEGIRIDLRDTDPANYAVDTIELYRTIISNAQVLATRTGLGMAWATSAFTLIPGSLADYTLPVGSYQRIAAIRIAATGLLLWKVGIDQIDVYRQGLIAGQTAGGDPSFFAMWEDASQLVNVRIDTVPSKARTVDVLRVLTPTTGYTDSTVLPFDDSFLSVVETASALELMQKMPQADRDRLGLNAEVSNNWQQVIADGIVSERARLAGIRRAPYGVGSVVG